MNLLTTTQTVNLRSPLFGSALLQFANNFFESSAARNHLPKESKPRIPIEWGALVSAVRNIIPSTITKNTSSTTRAKFEAMVDSAIAESNTNPTTITKNTNSITRAKFEAMVDSAIAEIEQYSSLGRGWDGYNGEPFNQNIVQTAISVVGLVSFILTREHLLPDEITPGPLSDGSIHVEIGLPKSYLIITIEDDGQMFRVYRESQQTTPEETVEPSFESLGRFLGEVVSKAV